MSESRALLAEADQERRIANAVESIGVTFRLGYTLAVKRGLFGTRNIDGGFRELNADESMLLYRAAQIVRKDALKRAAELESRVTTQGDPA